MSDDATWMRPAGSRIAHAFLRVALRAGERHDVPVMALRHCGTWPVAELEEDGYAERCRLCQFAVDELDRQSPEDESP